jgi:hypothetical protein
VPGPALIVSIFGGCPLPRRRPARGQCHWPRAGGADGTETIGARHLGESGALAVVLAMWACVAARNVPGVLKITGGCTPVW